MDFKNRVRSLLELKESYPSKKKGKKLFATDSETEKPKRKINSSGYAEAQAKAAELANGAREIQFRETRKDNNPSNWNPGSVPYPSFANVQRARVGDEAPFKVGGMDQRKKFFSKDAENYAIWMDYDGMTTMFSPVKKGQVDAANEYKEAEDKGGVKGRTAMRLIRKKFYAKIKEIEGKDEKDPDLEEAFKEETFSRKNAGKYVVKYTKHNGKYAVYFGDELVEGGFVTKEEADRYATKQASKKKVVE